MARKRHTIEQIIHKLREAEVALGHAPGAGTCFWVGVIGRIGETVARRMARCPGGGIAVDH